MKFNYDFENKKTMQWYAIYGISAFVLFGCCIYALVEFVLYLVKDNPFNWLSLWLTIGSFVVSMFLLYKTMTSLND